MDEGGTYRERVVSAAMRCFERDGVRQTHMADIAVEAGVSRKTLYRTFANRSELMLTIVDQEIRRINASLNAELQRFASLEEALVDGIVVTLRITRSNPLFKALTFETTDRSIETLIIDANEDIKMLFARSWRPLLERARASGELCSPLSDDRLIEGIRTFVALLVIRTEQDEVEQRQFLRDFLVPSILR